MTMATQIHGFGPSGELSPGAASALAGLGGASTLGDLTDVDTTGATTGQVLTFDGSEWTPDAPSAGTVTSTSISDSTATGRAVLTAADAATARSAIGAAPAAAAVPAGGTTGQVLTKASGTDYATAWETPSGGGGDGYPLPWAGWIDAGYGVGNTLGTNIGTVHLLPILIPWHCTVTGLAVQVTTAGESGDLVYLGLYDSHPTTGQPSSLVAAASSMATDSTGQKIGTVTPVEITAGVYWTAVYRTGTTCVVPTTGNNHASILSVNGLPIPVRSGDGWRAGGTVWATGMRAAGEAPLPATISPTFPPGTGTTDRHLAPCAVEIEPN